MRTLAWYRKGIPFGHNPLEIPVGAYLSIDMFTQVVGGTKTPVTETTAPVTITLVVPENLRSANRNFFVIYTHNGGDAKVIQPKSYNATTGVLTFEASKPPPNANR